MDDDPLVAALRRRDPADHPLGTEQLLAGARRRAGRIRTRRRAGVAVLALALVGVPVGIGVAGGLPGGTSRQTVVADPAPAGVPVEAARMLPDSTVAVSLPGAVRGEDEVQAADADVTAGLCTDVQFTAAPLLGGRTRTWEVAATREAVTQSVRRFDGDGAAAYVQAARDQAAACGVSAPETGPWTMVSDGSTGPDDIVTAWTQVQTVDADSSLYRVRGVVERDGVVVDVTADLVRANPDGLSGEVADLAVGGLDAVLGAD